jgi:hypothetical protein
MAAVQLQPDEPRQLTPGELRRRVLARRDQQLAGCGVQFVARDFDDPRFVCRGSGCAGGAGDEDLAFGDDIGSAAVDSCPAAITRNKGGDPLRRTSGRFSAWGVQETF